MLEDVPLVEERVTDGGQIGNISTISGVRLCFLIGAVKKPRLFYYDNYAASSVFSGMFSSRESQ